MNIKIICNYISLLIFLLFLPFIQVSAIDVNSYLVTEEQEFFGNPTLNTVYFFKSLSVNYKSGKVVLSANPDGTGEAAVGEELNIYIGYPGSGEFTYKINPCVRPHTKIPPLDITHLMNKSGPTNLTIRFIKRNCPDFYTENRTTVQYMNIGPMYLVHFNDYEPTAEPFLDLPWDYTSKGLSFVEAATSMFSYFDHEHPLLSASWFLNEPIDTNANIVNYLGDKIDLPYSGHDGYDYAFNSKAFLNDPILAAAPGTATFHNDCNACGNAIHIDHQNGYQTRYYHLQPDGLIINNSHQQITVSNRQQIGKIGLTGRTDGPHIHFMLIIDKNGDGNFDDNIPDGIVDPYGWQGSGVDPWAQFTFTHNGIEKTGTKSNYLWKNSLQSITKTLPTSGGNFTHDQYSFIFPNGSTTKDLIFSLEPIPYAEPSATLQPLSYAIDATATDGFGNFVTQFNKLFTLTFKLLLSDTSRLKPESLSIYSSSDGINWLKENTIINTQTNTATTQVNHLTQFAYMGEKLDSIAPETKLLINNQSIGETLLFKPSTIALQTTDEPSEYSLGVDYTLYKINENEWQLYSESFELQQIGDYTISYYSIDKDGNKEEIKTFTFRIEEQVTPTPTLESTLTGIPSPATNTPTPTLPPNQNHNQASIQAIIQNVVKQIRTEGIQKRSIVTALVTMIKTKFAF